MDNELMLDALEAAHALLEMFNSRGILDNEPNQIEVYRTLCLVEKALGKV